MPNLTVKCKSKNPVHCKFHGSPQTFEDLNIELFNFSEELNATRSLSEITKVKQNMLEIIQQIDTTHIGYSKLLVLHEAVSNSGNFAETILLKQRLQAADKVRSQDEENIANSIVPGSAADSFNASLEGLESLEKFPPDEYEGQPYTNLNYYFDDNKSNEHKRPATLSALRASLKNVRGLKDDAVRVVYISSHSTKNLNYSEGLEIYGPKDGRPLIINNSSGFQKLFVKSGNVVILADSHAGNVIHVDDEHKGNVVIIAGEDSKVTIESIKSVYLVNTLSKRVHSRSSSTKNVVVG